MNRRLLLRLVLTIALANMFALILSTQVVKAGKTSYVKADGSGDGTVTALSMQSTATSTLSLSSREGCYCTSNLGKIVFDGVAYSLPQTISKDAYSYSIRYEAVSGYEFSRWESSGEAIITDYYSSSTTVTINGDGTVVVIYSRTAASYTVSLDSTEDTEATAHLGNITFDSVTYSLPGWKSKASGTYSIRFNAPSGYEFGHWETIGGLTITDVNAESTSVVVSGYGYSIAVYKKSFQPVVHDLSISGIDAQNTSVLQGTIMPINVTVKNQGTEDAACNVTLYANESSVDSREKTLFAGEQATIEFVWNTSGFNIGGYTLKATVQALVGETHTEDNIYTYSSIVTVDKEYLTCDLNKDGTVNIEDITIVAVVYGSTLGDPRWNAVADLDNNGTINIVDVTMVAKDYGRNL